jgi:hypothetical protein
MNYDIMPDSKLNLTALINSSKILFTESEINLLKKSPWTWHNISGEIPEKSQNFYIDAGYHAFKAVIPLDNTLRKALKHNSLDNVTLENLKMQKKIDELNKLSRFLGIQNNEITSSNIEDVVYESKLAGFIIAKFCEEKLIDEKYQFKIKISDKNKKNFADFMPYVCSSLPKLAFVKGSYVEYAESGGIIKIPQDAYLELIVNSLEKDAYYNIIHQYAKDAQINNIPLNPLIVSDCFRDAFTFFDLDINEKTRFLYAAPGSDVIYLRKNPEKLLLAKGNEGLEKLRGLIVEDNIIKELCESDNAHRKINAMVNQPEVFYKFIKENKLDNLVTPPEKINKFNKNLPSYKIKALLAKSSIELSIMNQRLNNQYPR